MPCSAWGVAVNALRLTIVSLSVAGVLGFASTVSGQPKPSPTPISWELTFKPSPLTRIEVDTGSGPQTFWYMIYTVVNTTGKDVDFFPEVVRVGEIDDAGGKAPAGSQPAGSGGLLVDEALVGMNPKIFETIKQHYAKTHPFLVSPVEAIGRLLQGKDNARTSVIVFGDLDSRVTKFTIYFGGLSGETVTMPNPMHDSKGVKPSGTSGRPLKEAKPSSDKGEPEVFVVRKTLAMPYVLPGDAKTRKTATPAAGTMSWVMR